MIYLIDKLFGSTTRVKVLTKLFDNPDKSFYLMELARILDIPYSMLYKEVKNLEALGIVRTETRGKTSFIILNRKLPYFNALKELINKTSGIAGTLAQSLPKTGRIKYALIYGSFASGNETQSSDIDILIIGDVNDQKLAKLVSEKEQLINREINFISWTDEEFNEKFNEHNHFLFDVLSKPVIMLVGAENEFRRTASR